MRADYMAALGRGGDRMMGHLTPGETVIPRGTMTPKLWSAFQEALDKQGMMPEQYVVGSEQNSINPMTGQPEFLAQASAPGRSVRDYKGGRTQGPEGRDDRRSGSLLSTPQVEAYKQYGEARAAGAALPDVPAEDWVQQDGTWGTMTNVDMNPILDLLPGPVGPLAELAGVDMTFDRFEPAIPESAGSYEFNIGPESRDTAPFQGVTAQRQAMEEAYTRPASIPTPQFLGLSSSMSPLQQRSAVASRAIAGQAGEYYSPEAQAFYDNLLQRALIDDAGALSGLESLLPIDLQYLAQVRGIENPADTQALLAALAQ